MELEKEKESENCIWMSFRSHCREGGIALSFEKREHMYLSILSIYLIGSWMICITNACVFELSLTV